MFGFVYCAFGFCWCVYVVSFWLRVIGWVVTGFAADELAICLFVLLY